jgi:hypothetical protein
MRKVLVTRTARAPVHESQTTLATRTSLKQDLDDAHGELLPKNREEERQQGSSGGGCQTADVIESERYRAHLAYDCIAVAEIGERLDIACSEESLGRGLLGEDPFLVEGINVALGEQPVVGQSFSFLLQPNGA